MTDWLAYAGDLGLRTSLPDQGVIGPGDDVRRIETLGTLVRATRIDKLLRAEG